MQLDSPALAKLCGKTRRGAGTYTRRMVTRRDFSGARLRARQGLRYFLHACDALVAVSYTIFFVRHLMEANEGSFFPTRVGGGKRWHRVMDVLPESIPLVCEFEAKQ